MAGKKLPLNDWHAANGGQFQDFAGWSVPEAYGKMEMEYAVLRNGAGLVDLCPEARYRVEGADALPFLNDVLTANVNNIQPRTSIMACMCDTRGCLKDVFWVYRDEGFFLLMGSANARPGALEWLESEARKRQGVIYISDITTAQGQIGVRGPMAMGLMEKALGVRPSLEPGQGMVATMGTARMLVLRRGVGGYDGFDVIAGSVYLTPIWEKLNDAARAMNGRPVGFSAMEVFRVESGIPRYGYEVDADTTPQEANLGNMVDFQKKSFIGRRALVHASAAEYSRALVALRAEADRPIEPESEILFDNLPIGRVTSVVLSPVLRGKLSLGAVSSIKSAPGTIVTVCNSQGQLSRAELVKPGAMPGR